VINCKKRIDAISPLSPNKQYLEFDSIDKDVFNKNTQPINMRNRYGEFIKPKYVRIPKKIQEEENIEEIF